MRYREILFESVDELAALEQEREALARRWSAILKADPAPSDPAESEAWSKDPQRGGFWFTHGRPLVARIQALRDEQTKERRRQAAEKLKLNDGFDTDEVLYHGSKFEFERFDRTKARTASHIYTSPDLETAEGYGDIVYEIFGRQAPQADLSIEAYERGSSLFRKVYKAGGYQDGYDMSFEEFEEVVTNGEMYQNYSGSGLQDDVVDTCLGLGFRSVRFTDKKPGGGYSDSVVFGSGDDLKIIRRIA